ncbi:MAG: hypothetical protein K5920_01455 [Bacteroidales bacterium]|nr:hypothetical protein [Bacteroidales bacterium]
MKTQHLLLTLLMLGGVGCAPTPQAEKQHEPTATSFENDKTTSFVWPDTLATIPADVSQECYYDKTLAAYAADTGFYAFEDSCIENQYCFVASHIQPLKLPDEWKSKKELSDMVAFYNFMEILHAIETDYDACERYTYDANDINLTDEQLKAREAEYAETRKDFYAELDCISLKSIPEKGLQNRVKTLIREIKESESSEEAEGEENIWDINSSLDKLTESWLPDIFADSLRYASWDEKSSPQYYLPDWVPDVFDCFLGQYVKPTLDDKMEIVKRFNNSENFNEKVAWGFITLGVERLAPCEGLLKMCEEIIASGNYSPLLDILWRAYREKYNGTYSCPSTYCYSPNLRYNHFRRMVAYTTLRHIEAHPEDELARVQYYFMVAHTNILRLHHPYPFGNSAATEYMLLYWNQMLLYY